ncbi:hypothetical protein, partial [Sansalvadorimonas verongulae]|uniref:hypothetical protein n=1 Tax=Sansalvadorimonas verongulae TaxID=2172824 RepID=UPI001E516389
AVETGATTWIEDPSNIHPISSNNGTPDILCTPAPSSPPLLDILFADSELSDLEQNDALLSEISDLLPEEVFQRFLCTSAQECALNTDGSLAETNDTLTEVSEIQPETRSTPTGQTAVQHLAVETGATTW